MNSFRHNRPHNPFASNQMWTNHGNSHFSTEASTLQICSSESTFQCATCGKHLTTRTMRATRNDDGEITKWVSHCPKCGTCLTIWND